MWVTPLLPLAGEKEQSQFPWNWSWDRWLKTITADAEREDEAARELQTLFSDSTKDARRESFIQHIADKHFAGYTRMIRFAGVLHRSNLTNT